MRNTAILASTKYKIANYALQININPLGDRLLEVFFPEPDSSRMTFRQFAHEFAVFRPVKPGTPDEAPNSRGAKVRFLFR